MFREVVLELAFHGPASGNFRLGGTEIVTTNSSRNAWATRQRGEDSDSQVLIYRHCSETKGHVTVPTFRDIKEDVTSLSQGAIFGLGVSTSGKQVSNCLVGAIVPR